MKRKYEKPDIEVMSFEAEDIITMSAFNGGFQKVGNKFILTDDGINSVYL